MKLTHNTILITGGTSGIGLALAKAFLKRENTVIVTSRHQETIDQVVAETPGLHGYPVDVSDLASVQKLQTYLSANFSDLNVVINSAGIMQGVNLFDADSRITAEVNINLMGTINVAKTFLPILVKSPEAALINIGSGLGYVPSSAHPLYSASKAGVHALNTAIRNQAAYFGYDNIRVIQVAPPLVGETNLEPTMHATADQNPLNMKLDDFVSATLKGIEKDRAVINPGASKLLAFFGRFGTRRIIQRAMRRTLETEFPQAQK